MKVDPADRTGGAVMREKAPYGQPCNSCGRCCAAGPCPLGRVIFGQERGLCPALVTIRGTGKYFCGLVVAAPSFLPAAVARCGRIQTQSAAAFIISAGLGCDALDAGEAYDRGYADMMAEHLLNGEGMDESREWADWVLFGAADA